MGEVGGGVLLPQKRFHFLAGRSAFHRTLHRHSESANRIRKSSGLPDVHPLQQGDGKSRARTSPRPRLDPLRGLENLAQLTVSSPRYIRQPAAPIFSTTILPWAAQNRQPSSSDGLPVSMAASVRLGRMTSARSITG